MEDNFLKIISQVDKFENDEAYCTQRYLLVFEVSAISQISLNH